MPAEGGTLPYAFTGGFNSTPPPFGRGILKLGFNPASSKSPQKSDVELLNGLVGGFNKGVVLLPLGLILI
jgi:hypothetical protein